MPGHLDLRSREVSLSDCARFSNSDLADRAQVSHTHTNRHMIEMIIQVYQTVGDLAARVQVSHIIYINSSRESCLDLARNRPPASLKLVPSITLSMLRQDLLLKKRYSKINNLRP